MIQSTGVLIKIALGGQTVNQGKRKGWRKQGKTERRENKNK
jgi:hypothetical protein